MQKSRISVRRKAQPVQSTRQHLRTSRSSPGSSRRVARRGGRRGGRGHESSRLDIAAAVARRRIQRRAGTGNRDACARAIPRAVAKTSTCPRPACPQSPSPVFPFWAFALPMRLLAAKPYVEHPGDDAHIPIVQRRSLLDLDSRTCRWPVHDPAAPDFFFCGAQSAFGRPYCATHCARAYRAQGETPTTRERAIGEGE
jgi:GcrA cell cycle regulator